MKKRFLALLLAVCMLLTIPVLAVSDSMGNFRQIKMYNSRFSDVPESSTFYSNVKTLFEYGLTVGRSDGTFGLRTSVTVGQAVIFAARIRSIYRTGDAEAGAAAYISDGQAAYEPYLLYLQSEGSLGQELDGTYSSAATRAQVAHVLASILPEEALPYINDSLVSQAYASRQYITDVTEYTPYYQDILTLYRCGVSMGTDAVGTYHPGDPITRGELAAMLTRMFRKDLRVTPDWEILPAYSAVGTTYADLIEPAASYIDTPTTASEMDEAVRYMLNHGYALMQLRYDSLTSSSAKEITQLALSTVKSYCEQGYNAVDCSYSTETGQVSLIFYAGALSSAQTASYRDYALASAISVHDELWASGAITSSMSEYEKARVYYDWVCQNCAYDYAATDTSISHLPYAVFKNGIAVCDGYTGAYNLLLKLEGIDCTSLHNSTHIWTVATLDGTTYHIDTTWGDASGSTNYQFFGMTESQSWNYHSW